MNIEPYGRLSKAAVNNAETEISFSFPEDYRQFLTLTNGGLAEVDTMPLITLSDDGLLLDFGTFFGIGVEDDCDLIKVNLALKNDLPPNAAVIGKGSQGYFILVQSGDDYLLYFWDRDLTLDISSKDANAYLIADSFRDFWDKLGTINIYEKGDIEMERIDYEALGSIVLINGNIKKVLIISRGLIVKNKADRELFFDYAGVTYPEGLISDEIAYFNHDNIDKVIFEGYRDEDDEVTINNINNYLESHPDLVRGNIDNWDA